MTGKKILILGGTGEARELTGLLVKGGYDVVSSLAGVTASPMLPPGEIRIGGFGGVDGLIDYLTEAKIRVVLDATHPFAAVMSQHAFVATQKMGLPIRRLQRPPWEQINGDNWIGVADMAGAISALPANARVFVTTGRRKLACLLGRRDLSGVIRSIEPLVEAFPAQWQMLLDRPPQTLAQELELLRGHEISHVLSKNSGGEHTYAKIAAAREMGIVVVMIERPAKPHCPTFASLTELIEELSKLSL